MVGGDTQRWSQCSVCWLVSGNVDWFPPRSRPRREAIVPGLRRQSCSGSHLVTRFAAPSWWYRVCWLARMLFSGILPRQPRDPGALLWGPRYGRAQFYSFPLAEGRPAVEDAPW